MSMKPQSLLKYFASLPPEVRTARIKMLNERQKEKLRYGWAGVRAREEQLPPPGEWRTWLLLAGRGFGKTRTGAEWVRTQVLDHGRRRIALVAPTAADARDVMVEGESGLLNIGPPKDRPHYEPSKRRLTWANGAIATTYSADEPERLRGPQHDAAWCDEVAAWRYPEAYDQLLFGLRLGNDPCVVVTTTPKPVKIIRELMADSTTVITRGSSYANRANLPAAFFAQIIKRYEGTRLWRQEIEAEILDDVPGALWSRDLLEELRWPASKPVPDLSRVVVAIDPAVTSGEEADETGIIVAGRDYQGRGYVLDDRSGRRSSIEWAREAIMLYRKYDADRIVAEVNNGGDLVEATLRMVDENVSFNAVRASRGKVVRAEPVAALYEQKRCFHVGSFPLLEDQMTSFTSDFDRQSAGYSPDRVDALVWAFTERMVAPVPSYAAYEIARERAEAVIAQRRAEEEARRPKLSPAPGSVEYMELLKSLNKPR